MRGFFVSLILVIRAASVFSQETTMSSKEFGELLKNHPLYKVSELQPIYGEEELLKALGSFDPRVSYEIDQKQFDEKLYYSMNSANVKIPSWFGLAFYSGYQQNEGQFLNDQNILPPNGLFQAGASLALGNGLLIDKRRAELKKAKQYLQMSKEQQRILLNQLFFDAYNTYWDWYENYKKKVISENAYKTAQERFNAIKSAATIGERPLIDTIEASIQVQNRLLSVQQAILEYKNSLLNLNIYLWDSTLTLTTLKEYTIPSETELSEEYVMAKEIIQYKDSLINSHPELRYYNGQLNRLKIEERYKKELLKPTLNLKYNAINAVTGNDLFNNYSIANYTWGIEFNMPLFLRKQRGELNIARLNIQEANYLLMNKQISLANKFNAEENKIETLNQQIRLYEKTVLDNEKLLNGEMIKFKGGESSLFMVNSRELGYINAQLKLNELISKYMRAIVAMQYTLGTLGN